MSKLFKVSITADKWPTMYDVEAGSWSGAFSKAISKWKKNGGKGSRATKMSVTLYKVNGTSGKNNEQNEE
jgi:hypothetical protein